MRAAERALEVFRRVGVMAGNILGVVAVECAIDRGVVRLAGEFVAVNRGIERARYEIALLPRFGEIQLQFLIAESDMRE